jgi:hypothetical protein
LLHERAEFDQLFKECLARGGIVADGTEAHRCLKIFDGDRFGANASEDVF